MTPKEHKDRMAKLVPIITAYMRGARIERQNFEGVWVQMEVPDFDPREEWRIAEQTAEERVSEFIQARRGVIFDASIKALMEQLCDCYTDEQLRGGIVHWIYNHSSLKR